MIVVERPILMSAPMVRAILGGTKTQTRRVVMQQPNNRSTNAGGRVDRNRCPYGQLGDRLWVRETWQRGEDFKVTEGMNHPEKGQLYYRADEGHDPFGFTGIPWRPSIFMPRWGSRITLEVTGVRMERVREISEKDAVAEGVDPVGVAPNFRDAYRQLWDSLNAKRGFGWDKNPWVWVVEFKRV